MRNKIADHTDMRVNSAGWSPDGTPFMIVGALAIPELTSQLDTSHTNGRGLQQQKYA